MNQRIEVHTRPRNNFRKTLEEGFQFFTYSSTPHKATLPTRPPNAQNTREKTATVHAKSLRIF